MGEAFEQFKSVSGTLVEGSLKEATKKMERYVRNTLDDELHRENFGEWKIRFEEFQKENPGCPTFDELYGKEIKKRKRVEIVEKEEEDEDPEEERIMMRQDQLKAILETFQ